MRASENPLTSNEKIALGVASAAVVGVVAFAFSRSASAATSAPAAPPAAPSATRVAVNFVAGHRYQLTEPTPAGALGTVALVQAAFDAADPGTFHVVTVTPGATSETIVVDVLQTPTIVWALPLTATATDLGLTSSFPASP